MDDALVLEELGEIDITKEEVLILVLMDDALVLSKIYWLCITEVMS